MERAKPFLQTYQSIATKIEFIPRRPISVPALSKKAMIMKLLHVDSSVLGTNSVSRQLTADIVADWRRAHPHTTVDYLDLAVDTPNHFSADALGIKVGVQAEPIAAAFGASPIATPSARTKRTSVTPKKPNTTFR